MVRVPHPAPNIRQSMISKEAFKKLAKRFQEKYNICPSCLGVGCLPEHFGIANPNAQACIRCNGLGAILQNNKEQNVNQTNECSGRAQRQ